MTGCWPASLRPACTPLACLMSRMCCSPIAVLPGSHSLSQGPLLTEPVSVPVCAWGKKAAEEPQPGPRSRCFLLALCPLALFLPFPRVEAVTRPSPPQPSSSLLGHLSVYIDRTSIWPSRDLLQPLPRLCLAALASSNLIAPRNC